MSCLRFAHVRPGNFRRYMKGAFFTIVIICATMPTASHAQSCMGSTSPCFQGLGFLPGGTQSAAQGVSADGSVVVGYSGGNGHAFRWVNGTMSDLGLLPGGSVSFAQGVSADGAVVVGYGTTPPAQHAFRWVNGTMSDLGVLPGFNSSLAYGVNADGTIIVGDS